MTKAIVLIFTAIMAQAQTARFPGAVATDSDLMVTVNNAQSTLAAAMTSTDTTITVVSGSKFKGNVLLSIGSEIVKTCSVTGNTVQLGYSSCPNIDGRGFDGTSAISHSSGSQVSAFYDAWHHNAIKEEVKAIETKVSTMAGGGGSVVASSYAWSQTPGGSLVAGGIGQSVSLAQCPYIAVGTPVYLSGGTGAAETVPVLTMAGTAGSPSCSITITPANAHSGAWTIGTASGGLQEAICSLPAAGGSVTESVSVTLRANVTACGKAAVSVTKQTGATISGGLSILGTIPMGAESEIFDAGPGWPTYTTNWAAISANITGYPAEALFGAGTIATADGIRATVNVPVNATGGAAAISGYSMTSSATAASVGIFGAGFPAASGASTWGANFLTSNCASPWLSCGGTNNGINNWSGYGIEIDTGVQKTTGGIDPAHVLRGIYLVNAGDIDASGYGIDMDNPFTNKKMTAALNTADGWTNTFAKIGTNAVGNNAGSQALWFGARDAGGNERIAQIFADANGDFIIAPGIGANLSFADGVFNQAMALITSGGAPYIVITYGLTMGAAANVTIPAIKSTTGQRYVCVTTTGQLVSSATACSGT